MGVEKGIIIFFILFFFWLCIFRELGQRKKRIGPKPLPSSAQKGFLLFLPFHSRTQDFLLNKENSVAQTAMDSSVPPLALRTETHGRSPSAVHTATIGPAVTQPPIPSSFSGPDQSPPDQPRHAAPRSGHPRRGFTSAAPFLLWKPLRLCVPPSSS
ncbi:hypothetical protein VIGAN_08246800 [Vigna angularis var. angularis]|uniref:Uncharacterized protein n=1 Tax=Vigna angularis var. angularis TaxID=157739 RepID=A0A0S3SSA2_PHAAN|nr:hypothetical protein VIGAN_08246800 [Vigna angularis var. angularis]